MEHYTQAFAHGHLRQAAQCLAHCACDTKLEAFQAVATASSNVARTACPTGRQSVYFQAPTKAGNGKAAPKTAADVAGEGQ